MGNGFVGNLIRYLKNLSWGNIIKKIIRRVRTPYFFVDLMYYFRVGRDVLSFCQKVTKADAEIVRRIYEESIRDVISDSDYHRMLYVLTRIVKPKVFVETGVSQGKSSQAILKAMKVNGFGKLYSIDLPKDACEDGTVYDTSKGVGHLVPADLRGHWVLILGDSRVELPKLLESLGEIDVFLHDSLHTLEFMKFEYDMAWEHIRKGGLLLSHDIQWSGAFRLKSKDKEHYVLNYNIGGIVK